MFLQLSISLTNQALIRMSLHATSSHLIQNSFFSIQTQLVETFCTPTCASCALMLKKHSKNEFVYNLSSDLLQ